MGGTVPVPIEAGKASAMLGKDFLQQRQKGLAFGIAEIPDQPLFVLGHLTLELAQQGAPPGGQADCIGTAVMQGGPSLDQAAPLEIVDDRHHRRTIEMGGPGKIALLEVGIGFDDDQNAKQARRDVVFPKTLGKIAEQGDLCHA